VGLEACGIQGSRARAASSLDKILVLSWNFQGKHKREKRCARIHQGLAEWTGNVYIAAIAPQEIPRF
jgi:hypothetical protein